MSYAPAIGTTSSNKILYASGVQAASGASPGVLATVTLDLSDLAIGEGYEVITWGTYADNANNKRATQTIAGVITATHATATGTTPTTGMDGWKLSTKVIKIDATNTMFTCYAHHRYTQANVDSSTRVVSLFMGSAVTITSDAATVTAANDIIHDGMLITQIKK